MMQIVFYCLFGLTVVIGGLAYFSPNIDIMKMLGDATGYGLMQAHNRSSSEQINVSTNNGIMQMRRKMDDLALEQNRFIDTVKDQQRTLGNLNKEISTLALEAQHRGGQNSKDALKLAQLSSKMQDERNLLNEHSQELFVLNDQLTQNRQRIADQIDLANINGNASLSTLPQQYATLRDQTNSFFNKVAQHNQEVNTIMDRVQNQLPGLTNYAAYMSTVQQQSTRDRVQSILDQEQEEMTKLADSEDKNRDRLKISYQRFLDSMSSSNDSQQHVNNLIGEERQRAEEQGSMDRQHIADQIRQFQQMQDQHNLEVRDVMDQMRQHLQDLESNAANASADGQEMAKERMQDMLNREHEAMIRLADNEEKNKNLLEDLHQKLLDSKESSSDAQQRTKDLVEEEHLKSEDQGAVIKQQVADQIQHLQEAQEQYNNQSHDLMNQMRQHLQDLANNSTSNSADQQQMAKERIQDMLNREHEDMMRLADSEERSKELLRDAQEKQAEEKEILDDKIRQNKDMADEEHQKAQDQQLMMQQHIADQMQLFKDSQEQHNNQVHDLMDQMRQHLQDLANNSTSNSSDQQQMAKERMQDMLDHEHEAMIRLADNEERNKNLLQDLHQKLLDSKESSSDTQQRVSIQQRIADQVQQLQDAQAQHKAQVHDLMDQMRQHLQDLANNSTGSSADQQQAMKERIQDMLSHEHEDMMRLADSEERNRDLVQDVHQKIIDSKEFSSDAQQRAHDLIDEENQTETDTRERRQMFDVTTNAGLVLIRRQMNDLTADQNNFLDTIQEQQQILKNRGKEVSDILQEARQNGEVGNNDIVELQALTSRIQEEQQRLMSHGQDLIALNDQLQRNKQSITDQIEMAEINNQTSLPTLTQHYAMLKDQSDSFLNKVTQHNQEVRSLMDKMQDHLHDLANNPVYNSTDQQQRVKDRVQDLLDHEREDMMKLADSQQRSKELLEDARQKEADEKEKIDDKMRQDQDMIDDENQKVADQQEAIRQHIADQEQQMQDQQSIAQQHIADQEQQMQDRQTQ